MTFLSKKCFSINFSLVFYCKRSHFNNFTTIISKTKTYSTSLYESVFIPT